MKKRKYVIYSARTAKMCSRVELWSCVVSCSCLEAAWIKVDYLESELWRARAVTNVGSCLPNRQQGTNHMK